MNDSIRRETINNEVQKDLFAAHLGAKVEILEPGHSRVSMTISEWMTNFLGMTHGSLIFAVSDMAFGAASNSHGQTSVALNVDISFLKASRPGDQLVAEAKEVHLGGRTALYDITVHNAQTGELIAKSQDLAYRTNEWFVPKEA